MAALLTGAGCAQEDHPLAPEAKASALSGSAPKSPNAKQFSVLQAGKVGFTMDASEEKIRGRISKGLSGTIFVDVKDLSLTTGNVVADIGNLEIFQRVRGEDGTFSEETKSDKQNVDAQQWLEIDQSSPESIRARNRRVEFRITSIESLSAKDVTKLAGETRTVTLKAKGEFLLHNRLSTKNVDLEVSFTFDGDNPTAIKLKTVSPFGVNLAEHDVRPRKSFGRLAQKTLDMMGSKVAREAMVEIEIELALGDAPAVSASATAAAPAPSASSSAEPSPDASASASESASAAVDSASAAVSASAAASASASAAPAASASAKTK